MSRPEIAATDARLVTGRAGRLSLAVLLASTALGVVSAHAVDGTWVGATTEWTDPTNWTSNPSVPDGTATFSNTGSATVDANGIVNISAIQFTAAPNAQAFTISNYDVFIVNGAGMANNSTNLQTFNVNAAMIFQNASSASGGTGAVNINVSGGSLTFQNTSTAGTATIVNSAVTQFFDSSSAGSAGITNNATIDFFDSATASAATIGNAATGALTFNNSASAGTSIITNNGILQFNNA
ncbi:MAG: autotransporter, partial [bacterium]|nr:autotransporter [bacterium]